MSRVDSRLSGVVWIEKHNVGRYGRHRISQGSQLSITVSEATVVCELAEPIVLEVFTNLSFIVAVERSNYFWSWKVGRHRIVQITLLSMAVGK